MMRRSPAIYPRRRPAKMGTRASARTLIMAPLLLHKFTSGEPGLAHFARTLGSKPIAQVRRTCPRISHRIEQGFLHLRHGRRRWVIRVLDVQQPMEQTEPCIVVNVVGHGSDLMSETIQVGNRSKGNPRCSLLVHGMDHYVTVVESENAVRLVTVGEEAAGDCVTHDQRDHRMTLHARGSIRISGGGSSEEDR